MSDIGGLSGDDVITLKILLAAEEAVAGVRELKAEIASASREAQAANAKETASARAAADAQRAHVASVRNVKQSMDSLSGSISNASSQMNSFIGSTLKWSSITAGAAVAGITAWGVKSAAALQQTHIAFDTLLGNDQGEKVIGQLQKLDQMTPFTFPQLAQTTQMLVAYNVSATDAYNLTKSISDVASGTGKGVVGLQEISLALGQIETKGKVSGPEIRQLAEAGVPAVQMLAEIYSKSTTQVNSLLDKGVTFPAKAFIQAFEQESGSLQKFQGLSEKQSQTLLGVWSTFTGQMQRKLAPAFDPLTKVLASELPSLAQDLGDFATVIAPGVAHMADGALRFTSALLPVASPVILSVLNGLGDMFTNSAPSVAKLAADTPRFQAGISKFFQEVGPVLPDLIDLTGNLGLLGASSLPGIISPLAKVTDLMVNFANINSTTRAATGGLIFSLMAFNQVKGIFGTIAAVTTLINTLAIAEGRAALVGEASGLGVGGTLGKVGKYAGAAGLIGVGGLAAGTAIASGGGPSAGGLLAATGGGAAIGVGLGTFIPGIGNLVGAGVGAVAGAGGYLLSHGGDVTGSNYRRQLAGHSAAEAMTPGSRSITSGIRNFGLAGGGSAHPGGGAVDVAGSFTQAYAANVRALGGYAKVHDAGSGQHVHAEYGDVVSPGTTGSGDNAGMAMQPIYITAHVYAPMDLTKAVNDAIERRDRNRAVRR